MCIVCAIGYVQIIYVSLFQQLKLFILIFQLHPRVQHSNLFKIPFQIFFFFFSIIQAHQGKIFGLCGDKMRINIILNDIYLTPNNTILPQTPARPKQHPTHQMYTIIIGLKLGLTFRLEASPQIILFYPKPLRDQNSTQLIRCIL